MARNNSIDIFRLICAYMVVMIHTHPFEDINGDLGYFFTQVFVRIAVPFFFCVIGYYYFKNSKREDNFKRTFVSLIKPFLVWSIIYLAIFCLSNVINNKLTIESIFKKMVLFFVEGGWYHLWFFLAVFYNLIIIRLAERFEMVKTLAKVSIICYILGLFATSYNGLFREIPFFYDIVSNHYFDIIFRRFFGMGLTFMMMGYYLNDYINTKKINNKKLMILESLLLLSFLTEIYIVNFYKLNKAIFTTVLLYPLVFNTFLLLYNNPFPQFEKAGSVCRKLSSFIYFTHPIFILILKEALPLITKIENSQTLLFFMTSIFVTITGLVLYRFRDKKIVKILL